MESIVKMFERLRNSESLHHAYCIVGSSQTRVVAEAQSIASTILKVDRLPHTDCIIFDCEKDQSIESIRQFILDFQGTPLVARYRIGLLLNIQHLSSQSQNALLKTVEEPPAKGIFLCTTNHLHSLVPTIVSRVAVIRVKPFSSSELLNRYTEQGIPNQYAPLRFFSDEVPATLEEAEQQKIRITHSIKLLLDFFTHPFQFGSQVQQVFQDKEFENVPITRVVHWWIVELLKKAKSASSSTERKKSVELIKALRFYLQNDLVVNMPLWLQSILAQ